MGLYKYIFAIIFFVSCNQKDNSLELTNKLTNNHAINSLWEGEKIVFPKSISPILNQKPKKCQFTIVVYYNGSCSVCYTQLTEWIEHIKNIEKLEVDVDFRFILSGYNMPLLQANLNNIGFPVKKAYFDSKDEFKTKYDFLLTPGYTYSAMLLDENNKITYIGNPIISEKVMKKYIEIMQ